MSSLDFLQNLQNIEVAPGGGVASAKRTSSKITRQPTTDVADIRIWKDGSVYPSEGLIREYALEYVAKSVEDKGLGFDIIDGRKSIQLGGVSGVFIAASAKSEPKVDIFSSCTYDKDGNPNLKVNEQGATTFGKKTLLPLLKEVYGVEPNEDGYIDLNIVRDVGLTSPNGIWNLPKVVSVGPKKGQDTYQRRENITVCPLVPVSDAVGKGAEEAAEAEETIAPVTQVPLSEQLPTEEAAPVVGNVNQEEVVEEAEAEDAQEFFTPDSVLDGQDDEQGTQAEEGGPKDFFSDDVLEKKDDPFAD